MIEHRGITCLACIHMSLQKYPEHAKTGYATCSQAGDTFVRVQMVRNCIPYEAADPDVVEKRETWAASNIKMPAWQR